MKLLLLVLILATLGLAGFVFFNLQRARIRYWDRFYIRKGRQRPPVWRWWHERWSGIRISEDRKKPNPNQPPFIRWWLTKNVLALSCALGVYVVAVTGAIYAIPLLQPQQTATYRQANAVASPEEFKKIRRTYIQLSQAVEKNPEDIATQLQLARTLRDMGSAKQAMTTYRKVLSLQPRSPEALFEMGRLAVATGDVNLATVKANELAQLWPKKPEPHLILAQVALRAGNKAQAQAQWRTALGMDPANREARELLITYYLTQRSFADAAREAEAGVKLASDNIDMQILLAKSLDGLGRSTEALAILRTAAAKDRTSPAPLLLQGDLQVQRGEFIPAIISYEEVLKRSPGHVVAMNNIALLIADHGYELNRAAELASTLYTKYPMDPAVVDTMGWVLFKQGKLDQALPLLQFAAAGMPDNPVHRYHYGVALLKVGKAAAGRKELEMAQKIFRDLDGAARARNLR